MRKVIALATILCFIATAGLGLAMGYHQAFMVSGEVAAIENGVLSLRESNGQIFKVTATSDELEGIHIGDRVVAKEVKGQAVFIKDMGEKTAKNSTS